jgi:NADH-quinone oxidoreductase subunit G
MDDCDAVLLVGCNPRQEAPIIGHRLRQAWRKGAKIAVVNPLEWAFTFDTSLDAIVAPQAMVAELAALAAAAEKTTGVGAPSYLRSALDGAEANSRHEELAGRLQKGGGSLVLLGQFGMSHPEASRLRALAEYIA